MEGGKNAAEGVTVVRRKNPKKKRGKWLTQRGGWGGSRQDGWMGGRGQGTNKKSKRRKAAKAQTKRNPRKRGESRKNASQNVRKMGIGGPRRNGGKKKHPSKGTITQSRDIVGGSSDNDHLKKRRWPWAFGGEKRWKKKISCKKKCPRVGGGVLNQRKGGKELRCADVGSPSVTLKGKGGEESLLRKPTYEKEKRS